MKVIKLLDLALSDGGDTTPYPMSTGFKLQLKVGNVLDPYGMSDGWFGVQKPALVLNFFSWLPLPFMSLRFGRFGMYAGWKTYGVDSDAYKDRICPAKDVYPGSLAMCFTIRFSTSL